MAAATASASSETSDGIGKVLLSTIAAGDIVDSLIWAEEQGLDHGKVEAEARSLAGDALITMTLNQSTFWMLSETGQMAMDGGSPEYVVLAALPAEGTMGQAELKGAVGDAVFKDGFGAAKKLGWLSVEKGTGAVLRSVRILLQVATLRRALSH